MKDDNSDVKQDTIKTSIHCPNTKRKYIYDLRGGGIVRERVVQC